MSKTSKTFYNEARRKYLNHKYSAIQRGIPFHISLLNWISIWLDSGKWELRGCKKGQYVMSRFGDKGPYAVHNVQIVKQEDNHRESRPNQRYSEAAKDVFRQKHRGSGNPRAKLSEQDVRFIRNNRQDKKALITRFQVTETTINAILSRKLWAHLE